MPEWYAAMGNAKYLGASFTELYGLTYTVFVERWLWIARCAEAEAQEFVRKHGRWDDD